MKRNSLSSSTEGFIRQLEKAAPGPQTLRLMDATFALLGTNRERVAMAIHVSRGTIVQWSFELGKSPRAAVVRRLVIAHLDALAEEQLHGALAEERP